MPLTAFALVSLSVGLLARERIDRARGRLVHERGLLFGKDGFEF